MIPFIEHLKFLQIKELQNVTVVKTKHVLIVTREFAILAEQTKPVPVRRRFFIFAIL